MLKRTLLVGVLVVSTTALCGCPYGTRVQPGNWAFTFYDDQGAAYYVGGLTLNNDGTTAAYPVQGNVVHFVTGWWQDDNLFTIEQKVGSVHVLYTAIVESPTALDGESYDVDDDVVFGTFTAYRVDPNGLEQ